MRWRLAGAPRHEPPPFLPARSGGDADFLDALCAELHAAVSSGSFGDGASPPPTTLQRALDLAITRADRAAEGEEAECAADLQLVWVSPSGSGWRTADALHRVDAFDGLSLALPLPRALHGVLDVAAYRAVFLFSLRLKRASLAVRSLWSVLRPASAAPVPPGALRRLNVHLHLLGQLLRGIEGHTLRADATWVELRSAASDVAASPTQLRDVHDSCLREVSRRCGIDDLGVRAIVDAILGLALTLERDVHIKLAEAPHPAERCTQEAGWRAIVDSQQVQLARLCEALGRSTASLAAIASATGAALGAIA